MLIHYALIDRAAGETNPAIAVTFSDCPGNRATFRRINAFMYRLTARVEEQSGECPWNVKLDLDNRTVYLDLIQPSPEQGLVARTFLARVIGLDLQLPGMFVQ